MAIDGAYRYLISDPQCAHRPLYVHPGRLRAEMCPCSPIVPPMEHVFLHKGEGVTFPLCQLRHLVILVASSSRTYTYNKRGSINECSQLPGCTRGVATRSPLRVLIRSSTSNELQRDRLNFTQIHNYISAHIFAECAGLPFPLVHYPPSP